MTAGHGRFRRWLAGEAGAGPSWALAVVALAGALVAAAGPRLLASLENAALRRTLAAAGPLDRYVSASANWLVGSDQEVTAGQIAEMGRAVRVRLHPPLISPAGQGWAGMTGPPAGLLNPPPSTVLSVPPQLEIAYRARLARHVRLLAGSLPGKTAPRSGRAAGRPALITQAAVSRATAARFGLAVGSRITVGLSDAGLPLVLEITGIIRPADPGSDFWEHDPLLGAPTILTIGPPGHQKFILRGALLIGPGAVPDVETAYAGDAVQLFWDFPLDTGGLTAADVGPALAELTGLAGGPAGEIAVQAAGAPLSGPLTVQSEMVPLLTGFDNDVAAVSEVDSLVIVGVFAVGLILMLVCARALAGAHAGELALLRARGGSVRQAALLMAGRAGAVAGIPLAAGIAFAVLVTPDGGTTAGWLLAGIAVAVTLAGPAAVAAWQHRSAGPAAGSGRQDVTMPRRSPRRWVAEAAAALVLAGGAAALRLRGIGPGSGVDPYVSSVPVLVALVAALAAARAYPVPLRLAAALAARRKTAVGYLGLAGAARSRAAPLLPAMTLVVALAVVALAAMVQSAVSAGQVAASWREVGADAVVQVSGGRAAAASVTAAARRAVASVPGVTHAVAVYRAPAGTPLAGSLASGQGSTVSVSLLIADPARYAALTADTPWRTFPAAALARPPRTGASGAAGPGSPIPVIASPAAAAVISRRHARLEFGAAPQRLRVAGVISTTPAFPGGGTFIIVPEWARARLGAATPPPGTLLITGTAIAYPALRAAVRRYLPGAQLTSRQNALRTLASPPQRSGSALLFVAGIGAAAGFCAAAVALTLGLSRRRRAAAAARLAALGMTAGQTRALSLLDALPLVLTAVVGGLAAGAVLAPLVGPALDLTALTGSAAAVPVRPSLMALAAPAAGLVILVTAIAAADSALARRRHGASAALRQQEGR